MKNKLLIPILSVLIGVTAFVLTHLYLQEQRAQLERDRERIYGNAKKITVMAAARDIPADTTLKKEDIGTIEIYERQAPGDVVQAEQGELLLGKKTQFMIGREKSILWSYVEGGSPASRRLSDMVSPGMRAVSLSIGGVSAVSCMVLPDDRVDILGTFTMPSKSVPGQFETVTLTLLQDVTVLAVGQRRGRQAVDPRRSEETSYNAVTMEVTPEEAEVLLFTEQMKGRLTLTLRNGADAMPVKLEALDFNQLEGKLDRLNKERQEKVRHRRTL